MTCGAVVEPWSGLPIPALLLCLCSFVAGVIHPWRVTAFERLLWRACRGYLVASFVEMPEPMEDPATVRRHPGEGLARLCGLGHQSDTGCAVPRARSSPGSSSSSPTGVSRLGRRSARSRTGEWQYLCPWGGLFRNTHSAPCWGALTPPDMAMSLCPSFHCQVYPYPESEASRTDTMTRLQGEIQELSVVSWVP